MKKLIIINYGLCCRKKKGKTEKGGHGLDFIMVELWFGDRERRKKGLDNIGEGQRGKRRRLGWVSQARTHLKGRGTKIKCLWGRERVTRVGEKKKARLCEPYTDARDKLSAESNQRKEWVRREGKAVWALHGRQRRWHGEEEEGPRPMFLAEWSSLNGQMVMMRRIWILNSNWVELERKGVWPAREGGGRQGGGIVNLGLQKSKTRNKQKN